MTLKIPTPYIFQRRGVRQLHRFLKQSGAALLGDDMGLGKTVQALLQLHRHPVNGPVVVVCFATIKYTWEKIAAQFGIRAEVLEGTRPKRSKLLGRRPFVVINYDILHAWLPLLKELRPKMVIIDECQAIKTRGTKRTKAVRRLCRGVKYKLALSGTPIENRPVEFFPVLNLLRPDLFPSFHDFAQRYCAPKWRWWGWTYPGATHMKELHRILTQNVMVRRRKVDVLDELPAKQRSVTLLDVKMAEYREAERDLASWVAKRHPEKLLGVLRAEMLVRTGYLLRLAAELKLPAVFKWINAFLASTNEKLIVFGRHKSILRELNDRFATTSVRVDGSVTGRKRQHAIDNFLNSKKTRLFFGNMRAAGAGWSAKGVSQVAFVEFEFVPGLHLQCEDRAYGIGRGRTDKATSIHYLAARGTIEERMAQILQEKQENLATVLDGSKAKSEMDVLTLLMKELRHGRFGR